MRATVTTRRCLHAAGELRAVKASEGRVVDTDGDSHGGRVYGKGCECSGAIRMCKRVGNS